MTNPRDYIIVGAGSAGATLAGRLSENPDRRVLLLEAGGADRSFAIQVPGLVEQLLTSRTLNWQYEGEPDPSLGGRKLTWAAGRVLGGSSSINGMVFGRGLPGDYAAWEAAGNPGWGWEAMLPYFRKLEHWTGAPHPARGNGGPIWVRQFNETHPACAAAMAACVAAGVPFVDDYSIGITEGIGLTQATQKSGWRHSAATGYLRPARRRRNLTVLTDTRVDRLLIERGRCVGVVASRRGRPIILRAEREVIVAAGAIGTPKLLMLSGIGAPVAIKPHGITVVHELPGVGRGLNDHVNVKLSAFVDLPTYNTQRGGLRAIRHGINLILRGSGAASSPANHCQAFIKTDAALAQADAQIQLMAIGFGNEAEMRRNGITAVVSPCAPAVRGSVGLRSADPGAPPCIAMAMLESSRDIAVLLKACRFARTMLADGPCRRYGGHIYAPVDDVRSDADWITFFRATAALNWHPTSTCRMGPAGSENVVDSALRVHGLDGLSIVDASAMPSVTSANTNIPVIAIAERAAELVAARTA
jgi:choline dehydrogenase